MLQKVQLATLLPVFFMLAEKDSSLLINLQIVAGVTAITGHIFPVFAGFKGGKGVATIFGVLLALQPLLTISCFGVFLAVLVINRDSICFFNECWSCISSVTVSVFDSPSVVFKIFSIFVAVALDY